MDNNDSTKNTAQDKAQTPTKPMDSVKLSDQPLTANNSSKSAMARYGILVLSVILVGIAVYAIISTRSDSKTTDDTSNQTTNTATDNTQTTPPDSGPVTPPSSWTAPENFANSFSDNDEFFATLRTSGSSSAGDAIFGEYDIVNAPDDTFTLTRYNSSKGIEVTVGELSEQQFTSLVSGLSSELSAQSPTLIASDVTDVANSLNNQVTQIGLRFTTESAGQTTYHDWVVQVDYTADVAVFFELSSNNESTANVNFIQTLNRLLVYLY